jgi:hypothetical protein
MCLLDLATIFGLVISGLVSLAIALFVERAKLPHLRISIADPSDQGNARFLHVRISHQGASPSLRFFLQPSPALACVAKTSFLREDGLEAMPASFDARWTGSQQPTEFVTKDGQLFPSVFEALKKRDIHPKSEEKIDVCVKFDTDDACYVFNNSSYVKGFKAPDHKLDKGVYLVQVFVACGDVTTSKKFRLRNDFQRTDFRLEEL